MQQFRNSGNIEKRANKDKLQQSITTRVIATGIIKGQTKNLENKIGRKNNCTDTSSHKLKKLHMRWLGHC